MAGCLIVTGTFLLAITLVSGEDLSWTGDYYYDSVDLTQEQVWQDHGDQIKNIDVVGFELWITNNNAATESYDLYLASLSSSLNSGSTLPAVVSGATQVLNNVPAAGGAPGTKTHISYPKSFSYLMNVDALKTLTEQGGFKLFLVPSDNHLTNLQVDSLKVVVTFTAAP